MKLTHDNVRELLADVGPLTSREVAEFFPETSHWNVSSALSALRKARNKQVYIKTWRRNLEGNREHIRAVYALGDKPDAKQPRALTNAERCQRRRNKQRIPKVNSVWALGALAAL